MQNTQIRRSPATIAGDVIIYGVGLLVILITLVPLIHVLAMSVSDPLLVSKQEIYLIPRGINFDAYGWSWKTARSGIPTGIPCGLYSLGRW